MLPDRAEMLTSAALLFLSLDPVLILPVFTVPVLLVTVMLPPAAVVEFELRLAVLMLPLASRAIGPWEVVRLPLTAMLLAAFRAIARALASFIATSPAATTRSDPVSTT
jgi:hypothetical protein